MNEFHYGLAKGMTAQHYSLETWVVSLNVLLLIKPLEPLYSPGYVGQRSGNIRSD